MKTMFLFFVLILSAVFANAQSYSVVVGGTFDAGTVPHSAANLALLISLDNNRTFSYTSFDVRGLAKGQVPTYVSKTGIASLLRTQGRTALYADGQLGAAANSDATSGAVSGGGFLGVNLSKHLDLVLTAHALKAPAAGDLKPVISLGFRLTP